MKPLFLLILSLWGAQHTFAQKRHIDSAVYSHWPIFEGEPLISNNGKIFTYTICTGLGNNKIRKLFIQSTEQDWKVEIPNIKGQISISTDNKFCIYMTQEDSLVIFNVGTRQVQSISNVLDFNIPKTDKGEWLVYKQNYPDQNVTLCNLKTGYKRVFQGQGEINLSDDGRTLVIQASVSEDKTRSNSLKWIDLTTGIEKTIWENKEIKNLVVDFKNHQLAFKSNDSIVYYKNGMNFSKYLTFQKDLDSSNKVKIGDLGGFNQNGDRLCFYIIEDNSFVSKPIDMLPEIWSYLDANLQSVQENEISNSRQSYLATIRIKDHKLIRLQKYSEESIANSIYDDFFLSTYASGGGLSKATEYWWSSKSERSCDLVDGNTGERRLLKFLTNTEVNYGQPTLSPKGRYLIYYDIEKNDYISYNLKTGELDNLTKGIRTSWCIHHSNEAWKLRGIAGWLPDDKAILIYDSYDIWKFDLSGVKPRQNITNNYGEKNRTIFSLISVNKLKIIDEMEPLLFSALDWQTKDNGFFSKRIDKVGDPVKLSMGPYLYKIDSRYANSYFDFTPLKAKNAKIYLIKRQSSTKAPNYFTTSDFKSFKQLTYQEPQKDYNWYQAELHNWTSLNGDNLQGILYKPENFNPEKKYPVIFYFYERLSDGLNSFLNPEYSRGRIDIPTYVSNGYLVFCPDIYYIPGDPMQGTYDAVVSAANYLSTRSFVDTLKMGLQGHSFGAIQTNYLIAHSNLFAAACSASGTSDWISLYGSLMGKGDFQAGSSFMSWFDNRGQFQMKDPLWFNKKGYIKNSTVLYADRVSTPLLIMHGKLDTTCPFPNILELFLGLRRLGKKVWMTVYNKSGHDLYASIDESKDFTIRMQQFFDYYLKDKQAPIWMLNGVAAKERAFGAGTELDTKGRTPGPSLLTMKQQLKVDSLIIRKPITITLK